MNLFSFDGTTGVTKIFSSADGSLVFETIITGENDWTRANLLEDAFRLAERKTAKRAAQDLVRDIMPKLNPHL